MPTLPADPDRWARVADVFDAVADLPPSRPRPSAGRALPHARRRARRRAARRGGGAARRRRRGAHPRRSTWTAPQVWSMTTPGPASASGRGASCSPSGRGGMGRVDLVERADGAYRQRAALKRLGLVAPSRLRRFLRERQILASLQHPGIARLLDGGVHDGAPYLVMEYVRGAPITRYADDAGLDLPARLGLFLQVVRRRRVRARATLSSHRATSSRPTCSSACAPRRRTSRTTRRSRTAAPRRA